MTEPLEIVKLLLAYGANPNPPNRKYWSPLHQAANFGWEEVSKPKASEVCQK
jgi:ankyrin repeat protein